MQNTRGVFVSLWGGLQGLCCVHYLTIGNLGVQVLLFYSVQDEMCQVDRYVAQELAILESALILGF